MIEIYKDFVLVTAEPTFKTFQWRRRFSKAGEFQFETFFTKEKFIDFFATGNVIYIRELDEAAFIEKRSIIQTRDNELVLIARGRALSSILDRRIFTMSGSRSLTSFLASVVNNNFLSGAGSLRQIPQMRFTSSDLSDITVSADFKQRSVYDEFIKILEENNIGVKVIYNIEEKTYDLIFYKPTQTSTVFSREFANVVQQDYFDDAEKYKNVAYVDDVYVHNNTLYTGLERREVAVSKPTEGASYYTQTAINALNENKETRTLSNVINPHGKQFEYLKDWDIGSIVLSENKELGFSESGIITEITEFHDERGANYEVNIGDYIERKK